jgi:hypothetical protein
MMQDTFGKEDANLEKEIRRATREAKGMGIKLLIVSHMLVLQKAGKEGIMIIVPMPRSYVQWQELRNWHLYELLYSRAYRRRTTDYGEEKPIAAKSSTRKEIYAKWDE